VTHVPDQEPIPEGLSKLMAARGVASIPTLAVELDMADFIRRAEVLDNKSRESRSTLMSDR
jgi:hypothetical protein